MSQDFCEDKRSSTLALRARCDTAAVLSSLFFCVYNLLLSPLDIWDLEIVVVPLLLGWLNSLNRILYIPCRPVWFSFCLKWLANWLFPTICDLQLDLLYSSSDKSSCPRLGVKALCGAEFWGMILLTWAKYEKQGHFKIVLQQYKYLFVYPNQLSQGSVVLR